MVAYAVTITHMCTYRNTTLRWANTVCSYSELFCHTDKAITLKGLAPWEFNHLFYLSSHLSLFSFSQFFLHLTYFLSFLKGYITLYPALHASLFTNERCYTCIHRHSHTVWERMRGREIKAAHIQSTDATTCAKRGRIHQRSERVQTHTINTHTHKKSFDLSKACCSWPTYEDSP